MSKRYTRPISRPTKSIALMAGLSFWSVSALSGNQVSLDFVHPTHTFGAEQRFIDATGAQDLTGALPELAGLTSQQRVGSVTFQAGPPSQLAFGAFVADSQDFFQLVVDGEDHLHLIPDSPRFSLGFRVEEPNQFNPNADGALGSSAFTATLCQVTFSPESQCPEAAVIDQVQFETLFRNINGGPSPFFGVWSHLPIAQMSVRQTSQSDASEFFARVFGGTTPRPMPENDQFESDNRPDSASFLADSIRGTSVFAQTHSFPGVDQEDWIFYEGNVKLFEISVLSEQPQFHARLEMYRGDRLFDPTAQPVQTLGSCDEPAEPLVFNGDYPTGVQLFRVINCAFQPPMRYEFILQVIEFDDVVLLGVGSGEAINETNGNPASVAIVSNTGRLLFSSPRTGRFIFAALQGEDVTLNVISPQFEADPIVIPALGPFDAPDPVTILVRERSGPLVDGFEG